MENTSSKLPFFVLDNPMTNSPLPLVAGLLGAGILGGLTATFFAPAPVEVPTSTGAIAPAAAQVTPEQLSQVLESIDHLSKRIGTLELMPASTRREVASEPGLTLPIEELEQAIAAVLTKQAGGTSGVQNIVAESLGQIRAQEEVDRDIARDQRRVDQLQKRVDDLTEKLALYPDQASKMLGIFTDENAKRDELRDAMRNGTGDMDSWRTLRDDTKTAIGEVLTPEQLDQYNESNQGFGGFGGFGGGRRNGGQ